MTPWFSVEDVTYLTGFSKSTIRRAADGGKLQCTKTPGGHHRFTVAQVHSFLLAMGLLR